MVIICATLQEMHIRNSYLIIICANSCQNQKQKQNWVKLKLVLTLLRIACLANRKSYVVIIFANSCEKLIKSENEAS